MAPETADLSVLFSVNGEIHTHTHTQTKMHKQNFSEVIRWKFGQTTQTQSAPNALHKQYTLTRTQTYSPYFNECVTSYPGCTRRPSLRSVSGLQ